MAKLAEIEEYLKEKRVVYKVIDEGGKAGVVKTLVMRVGGNTKNALLPESGMDFAALCLRGEDRVDFRKVRARFGSKSELARPEEVLKVCGVPIGAVCPILIGVPVYVDEKVLGLQDINLGSGDLEKGLEMKLTDLLEAIGKYQVADLVA